MGLDMRYLVITLVAVFLALGLGMLAGGAVMGEGGLAGRHDALVAHLEAEFERLRSESRRQRVEAETLRAELEDARRALAAVIPAAVAGRLRGQRVAIVCTAAADPPGELTGVLEAAGAELITFIRVSVDLEPEVLARRVAEALASSDRPPATLADAIAEALSVPEQFGLLEHLAQAGLMRLAGGRSVRPTAVLVLGGTGSGARTTSTDLDLPLATRLREAGLHVVWAAAGGDADPCLENIPCTRRLGDPTGMVSLVYLLAGEADPLLDHHSAGGKGS